MIYRQKVHPLFAMLLVILLLGVLALLVIFAVGLFQLLFLFSPVFLVLAAIFDSSVFTRWWKKLALRFQVGLLNGLLYSILQLLLLPFVSINLLIEAYILYKMKGGFGNNFNDKQRNSTAIEAKNSNKEGGKGEYIDYEEI
jgi:hypothetical protein